ncbi:MAG: ABC transporter substrate-binding protein [Actinomycetales bacterium]|nr:ABC transporter substrate-binding protein [Actinomycetales bacterium]
MKRSRNTAAAAAVASLGLLLAACGGGSDSSSSSQAAASGAAPAASAPAGDGSAPATASGDPITIGMPIAQSGPAGIADHKDCWNGAILAQDGINAAGGVNGRPIELDVTDIDILSPEGITAGFQKLTGDGVQAIVSPFVIIPPPALDAAAAYGAPYMSGDTNIDAQKMREADPAKYGNYFVDPAETYYGSGLVPFLDELKASGGWTPTNNTVSIVRGDTAYNKNIADATVAAVEGSGGAWQMGDIIDITAGTKDWSPVIQKLKAAAPGVIMVDHWIGAELASFSKQFAKDPVPGSLVYLQYGPSQPEYLQIAGADAEGFVWGTVIGTGNTSPEDKAFRQAYQAKFGVDDKTMGMVYPAWCYDMVHVLANAWSNVDPTDFAAVNAFIAANPTDGVTGHLDFSAPTGATPVYPDQVSDPAAGVTHYFYQVQDGRHTVIAPTGDAEAPYKPQPWQ